GRARRHPLVRAADDAAARAVAGRGGGPPAAAGRVDDACPAPGRAPGPAAGRTVRATTPGRTVRAAITAGWPDSAALTCGERHRSATARRAAAAVVGARGRQRLSGPTARRTRRGAGRARR